MLDLIHSPADLAQLSLPELNTLADEIRTRILQTVSENGGHLAPNLGVVDLCIALHRVFHAPEDKILWDVGHQAYAHKLLTGRVGRFGSIRTTNGLSGFTARDESEFDCFGAGHAGTAISAAMGFSVGNDLDGGGRHAIAVVGDGALICGVSLEALNNVRTTCKNLIIVVNDNKMSIDRSIGAIPNYLNRIITGRNYNRFKALSKMMLGKIPGGDTMIGNIQLLESTTKRLFVPGIFFEEMGLRYVGPINGHNLPDLIQTLERVKAFNRPVLVHVITEKGHGCEYAVDAPEKFHGIGRFNPENGNPVSATPGQTFSDAFGDVLLEMTRHDEKLLTVTAAMAAGCGVRPEQIESVPDRFFDVGIAEEHAVVFAAGLAAAGYRPVVAIYATFLQRALDCIFHDVCLQNLPVIFCADRAGIVEDGPTHHGIYDVSFLRTLPNLSILMPRSEGELQVMFRAARERSSPVVIRYPRGSSGMPEHEQRSVSPLVWGRAECLREGADVSIWAAGREVGTALDTAAVLAEEFGISARVVHARFLKPFDSEMLAVDAKAMPLVTMEDHVVSGGLGGIVADVLAETGIFPVFQLRFGWSADAVVPHGNLRDLRVAHGLDSVGAARKIAERLGKSSLKNPGHGADKSSPSRISPGSA